MEGTFRLVPESREAAKPPAINSSLASLPSAKSNTPFNGRRHGTATVRIRCGRGEVLANGYRDWPASCIREYAPSSLSSGPKRKPKRRTELTRALLRPSPLRASRPGIAESECRRSTLPIFVGKMVTGPKQRFGSSDFLHAALWFLPSPPR